VGILNDLVDVPEPWWGAAVLAAILGGLGFLAKSIWDIGVGFLARRRERRAALVRLYSLLRATEYSFKVQNANARRLADLVTARNPANASCLAGGFDELFARTFANMTAEEKDLHAIVRSVTVYSLNKMNRDILDWLRLDTYFKARRGKQQDLASLLSRLEIHLELWIAKYEVWIPGRPEHALVYLAAESKHGVGFPHGIEEVIRTKLGLAPPMFEVD
jgi:hypothetical protein